MLHPQMKLLCHYPIPMEYTYDAFGLYRNSVEEHWYTCRDYTCTYIMKKFDAGIWEKIHLYYLFRLARRGRDSYGYILDSHEEGRLNIARWFDLIESRMGWQDRTFFHTTERDHIMEVRLSPGWLQNQVAISLMTLMLRIGPNYREGVSMDAMLTSHDYAAKTVPAIHRFFAGYQHYTGSKWYWVDAFKRALSLRNLEKLLIDRKLVEDLARKFWIDEGRLVGYDSRYWLRACRTFSIIKQSTTP